MNISAYIFLSSCLIASVFGQGARSAQDNTGRSDSVNLESGETIQKLVPLASNGWVVAEVSFNGVSSHYQSTNTQMGHYFLRSYPDDDPTIDESSIAIERTGDIDFNFANETLDQKSLPNNISSVLKNSHYNHPDSLVSCSQSQTSQYSIGKILTRQSGANKLRAWYAAPVSPISREFHFIRMTKITKESAIDGVLDSDQEVSYQPIVLTIPANQNYSQSYDIESEFDELDSDPANVDNAYISQTKEDILIPVSIEVANLSTTIADPFIPLGKVGDLFSYALHAPGLEVDDSDVQWEYRKLRGDGSFDQWKSFGTKGRYIYNIESNAGICQIQAVIDIGSDSVACIYSKNKFDSHAKDSLGIPASECIIGKPEYVGIAKDIAALKVCEFARTKLGDKSWATNAAITPGYGVDSRINFKGEHKCNIFVFMMANGAGKTMPTTTWRDRLVGWPPYVDRQVAHSASQIWQSSKAIAGWTWHDQYYWPSPGDVVAKYESGRYGHTGIVDFDGSWISAGPSVINRYYHIVKVVETQHYRN